MKIGVSLPVFTQDAARPMSLAVTAAELGFDGVFCPDHLLSPAKRKPALEAFSVLAAVAARDLGLHVGTLVARVGLRAPGMLAKQAAALDSMSSGRGIIGLGAGDAASLAEHEAFDIPFPTAGERLGLLEETALALRELFDGRPWGRPVGTGHDRSTAAAGFATDMGGWSVRCGRLDRGAHRGCVERMGSGRGCLRGKGGVVAA